MNAMIDAEMAGLVELLRDRGLDTQLMEERQLDREEERAELLRRALAQEAEDEAAGVRVKAMEDDASHKLAVAEASAAAARRLMCEAQHRRAHIGVVANQLRGKLRGLADPRIDDAIRGLREMAEKVRAGFTARSSWSRTNPFTAGVREVVYSNALESAECLAAINVAIDRLEVVKDQPRPADLRAFINDQVEPVRPMVQRLIGQKVVA
jgi:hypothetical protein